MRVDFEVVRREISKTASPAPETKAVIEIPLTPPAKKVFECAVEEAKHLKHSYVGTEHLLLGLLREEEGGAARIMATLNVDAAKIRCEILSELNVTSVSESEHIVSGAFPTVPGEQPFLKQIGVSALDAFGCDLTALAKEGKLDPVIGRASEIERVIQILCRRTKNNPVLIGEAGVGKTAIVEGLAQEIEKSNVPEFLLGKKIFSLDVPLLTSGTLTKQELKARCKTLLEELRKDKQRLLFIDDSHLLSKMGMSEDTMETFKLLRMALSQGEIQCIGATRIDTYPSFMDTDFSLERRFQPFLVKALSVDASAEVLKRVQKKYEAHHQVSYTPKAIRAIVDLSARHIPGSLPDKALDVMDEAGARAHVAATLPSSELQTLRNQLTEAQAEKIKYCDLSQYDQAALARDRERELQQRIKSLGQEKTKNIVRVDESDILQMIAQWTDISINQLTRES